MTIRQYFLAILGLSAFAVAQPILSTLGQGATFFVAHGAGGVDVIISALVIFLLPPILLCAIAACVSLISSNAGKNCVSFILGILAALYSMTLLSKLSAAVSIPLALVVGLAAGTAYLHVSRFRELLQWIGILSPLVVISFLFFTPANSMIFPEKIFERHAEAQKDTPIVMILLDELSLAAITTPDGQIDAARLPNFSRLAQLSTWYFDTSTVSTRTDRSVPAILSGLRPREDVPPIYSEFSRNLFSLFAATHAINVVESVTKLCPDSACPANASPEVEAFYARAMYRDIWVVWQHAVFPADLAERHLPSISAAWGNFNQEEEGEGGNDQAIFWRIIRDFKELDNSQYFDEFLDLISGSVGPSVNYFHLDIPHTPWTYLPDGTKYNGKNIPGVAFTHWFEEKHLVDQAILRYSLQVEYADLLIGQTLDAIERSGRMKDVMLIVVSDHGTAFKPGGDRRVPEPSTLADVARVPLFIKYPGQVSGVRDNRKIETIDILPTIADVAQLRLSDSVDGQSLISESWQPATRSVAEADSSISDFEGSMNLKAASERIYEVIEPGVSALNATGFGLAKKYTGKPLPDRLGFNNQLRLRITSQYCFQSVNKGRNFRPIHLIGVLEGASTGQEVMVALNGRVAGSGMATGDENTVSIVLDPRIFISGKNEVRAFTVTDHDVAEISVICGKGKILSPSQAVH